MKTPFSNLCIVNGCSRGQIHGWNICEYHHSAQFGNAQKYEDKINEDFIEIARLKESIIAANIGWKVTTTFLEERIVLLESAIREAVDAIEANFKAAESGFYNDAIHARQLNEKALTRLQEIVGEKP